MRSGQRLWDSQLLLAFPGDAWLDNLPDLRAELLREDVLRAGLHLSHVHYDDQEEL